MNAKPTLERVNALARRWWGSAPQTLRTGQAGNLGQPPASVVVRVPGRLTIEQVGSLKAQLEEAVHGEAPRILVDLNACPFIDSAGLAALVTGLDRARKAGKEFCLVGLCPQVRCALELARLDKVFATSGAVDTALGS